MEAGDQAGQDGREAVSGLAAAYRRLVLNVRYRRGVRGLER